MQIKYLKDAPTAQTGDICEVPDDQAGVLITLGIAEALTDKKPKQTKAKTDKNAELELS